MSSDFGLSDQQKIMNYGSYFKTTGGGNCQLTQQQMGGMRMPSMNEVNRFVRRVMNNRVFDLYLKYLGITILTPSTLVPIALIMGVETFHKVVRDMKRNDENVQRGGKSLLDIKIPVIDNRIIGNGLKIAGIYGLSSISPYTLIPVGVLMLIYERMRSNNGSRSKSRSKSRTMRGGSGSMVGSNVPPSLFENVRNVVNGGDIQYLRGQDFDNRSMQLQPVAFDSVNSYAPYQSVATASATGCTSPNCAIAPVMAGGAVKKSSKKSSKKSPKKSVKKSSKKSVKKSVKKSSKKSPKKAKKSSKKSPKKAKKSSKKSPKKAKKSQQRGGSSDWMSTVNSRGPSNQADMSEGQFRSFNQTAPLVSNSQLGAANPTASFYNFDNYRNNTDYVPLYKQ